MEHIDVKNSLFFTLSFYLSCFIRSFSEFQRKPKQAHDQFLETCLRECHLTNKSIFKLIHKIMAQVTIYVNYVNQIHRQVSLFDIFENFKIFNFQTEMRSATSLSPDMRDEYLRGIFSSTFDHQISEMDRTFDSLMLRLGEFFCLG